MAVIQVEGLVGLKPRAGSIPVLLTKLGKDVRTSALRPSAKAESQTRYLTTLVSAAENPGRMVVVTRTRPKSCLDRGATKKVLRKRLEDESAWFKMA